MAHGRSDFLPGALSGADFRAGEYQNDIYFGTINTSNPDYVRTALRDEQAAKYIKGVGSSGMVRRLSQLST